MSFRSDPGYMVNQYEALRKQVLESDSVARRGHGLALFLTRGMPGWLTAVAALAQSAEKACGVSENRPLSCRPNLPSSVQLDFTSVLADMVLALHLETMR